MPAVPSPGAVIHAMPTRPPVRPVGLPPAPPPAPVGDAAPDAAPEEAPDTAAAPEPPASVRTNWTLYR